MTRWRQVIAENVCQKTFFIRKEHVVSGQKEIEAQGMFSDIPVLKSPGDISWKGLNPGDVSS
jgi:hypothetical protein